ncbi:PLP-dependent aminotransferase family protein [Arcobacter sp. s6]|jgi:GntR family transcriptional regulator / MocR family aminotransferase|uniref:MocR-like pyridoxine biosynthesis transcription factor PdxR n=1 Tax=Arcobacter sp. s6 TaxID=3230363 RepID=UPI0034A0A75E
MYIIDANNKIPLHIQLYNEIKNDIINNLNIGDKLPSIRKVSSLYNLSKTTVESAYTQLYAEGYIESYPKSGYIVCDTIYKEFTSKNSIIIQKNTKTINYKYDFAPARLSKNSFPLKLWKRVFNKAIDESINLGAYTNGKGEFGLKEEIAKYLISSRGVRCHAEQVIITNGFGDSMNLLAKMLKNDNNLFAIENPGYYVASQVFENYGYEIDKISINENGINIDELNKSKAKIVYVTPSHQYPTGVSIPISNRLKLLEWANTQNGIILEDDYDSELSYSNRPIPSLQGLDDNEKVVYLGTFSKSLSPALRVSYMVLPIFLLQEVDKYFDSYFSKVSLFTQKTLELFIKDGHWDKHLRKIRTLNRKKHNLMRDLLKEYLKETMEILVQGGGLSILIKPTVNLDLNKLKEEALKEKIKIYFTNNYEKENWWGIRMGFGGFEEDEIKNAVIAFSKIYNKSII